MKHKKKPYWQRKPFKMKKGGGAFRFAGGAKYPSPIMMLNQPNQPKSQQGMVKSILQTMGFRIAAK